MWSKKDLLSIDDLSRQELEFIIKCAGILEPFSSKGNKLDICRGEIATLAFFEPSTRTEKSFQAAMYTLGGDVIIHKDTGSSREKGESKSDTLRTLEQYSDIIVVRDPEVNSVSSYSDILGIPVINPGDGSNEHPTQAMIDMYTIWKRFGTLAGLKVAFVGDLKYGRPFHSLIKILSKFNSQIFGISPPDVTLGKEWESANYKEFVIDMRKLNETLAQIKPDVVYAGRIRREYMTEDPRKYSYKINRSTLDVLPENCIIMHALPRVDEIDTEIDASPKFMPFRQVRYGLQTRMAILALMLGHEKEILELEKD